MELDFTSNDIEKLLLKRLLVDKNWLNIVSNVYDERWFKVKYVSELVKICVKYYGKYKASPTQQVLKLLANAYATKHPGVWTESEVNEFISDIGRFDPGIPEDVINSNLREFIRKNAFSWTLLDNSDILAEAEHEKSSDRYEKTIEKCLENFDRVQKITFNDTDLGLNYFDKMAQDTHWEFLRNPDAKIKTGWEGVDHYTNGGFLKDGRMLALIMAQAGLGKSVFLSNLAVNMLKQGLSVVVISLEMSQDVYAQRFDAHISSKNINMLRENEQTARDRINAFYAANPESQLIIKEYPPRSINSNVIDSYLESLKTAGYRIDAIIIDYLNLVMPNKSSDSMFKDGLTVSEELRALSYKYKAPVITAAQCNSEGMNSADIDMQNISESRGIVHTVDFLGALFQTQDMREQRNGEIGFKIIKNRLGGCVGKKCSFQMDPGTLVVTDHTFNHEAGMAEEYPSELTDAIDKLEAIQSELSAL